MEIDLLTKYPSINFTFDKLSDKGKTRLLKILKRLEDIEKEGERYACNTNGRW